MSSAIHAEYADAGYRETLAGDVAIHKVMKRAISDSLASGACRICSRSWGGILPRQMASYPIAYDASKALNTAAKSAHEAGCAAQ